MPPRVSTFPVDDVMNAKCCSPGFSTFFGTSAAAPVAAAITTLIRAACAPEKVWISRTSVHMEENEEFAHPSLVALARTTNLTPSHFHTEGTGEVSAADSSGLLSYPPGHVVTK